MLLLKQIVDANKGVVSKFEEILSEEQFNDTISKKDQPVLIKFFADWCPDCKRMDMFIGEVLADFQNISAYSSTKINLKKLRIDRT